MMGEPGHISSFEVLLLEEYARRLSVSRSKICDWKKDGTLIPGHHYFQRGRVVRYIWARDLVLDLHEHIQAPARSEKETNTPSSATLSREPKSRRTGINLEY